MTKLETDEETIFSVFAPPHVGHYKLEIFAAKIPKTRGKFNLPVVATFMVEVKLKTLFAEVVAQKTGLDISAPPSVHTTGHKLASIAEILEDKNDSPGSKSVTSLLSRTSLVSRTSSASRTSLLSRTRSLLSLRRKDSMDGRKSSVFSLESLGSSRKVSDVPNSQNMEDRY